MQSITETAYALLPEVDARAALSDLPLRLTVLVPPYPAVGLGTLRMLRVAERAGRVELVAGYDGYLRLGEPERPRRPRA